MECTVLTKDDHGRSTPTKAQLRELREALVAGMSKVTLDTDATEGLEPFNETAGEPEGPAPPVGDEKAPVTDTDTDVKREELPSNGPDTDVKREEFPPDGFTPTPEEYRRLFTTEAYKEAKKEADELAEHARKISLKLRDPVHKKRFAYPLVFLHSIDTDTHIWRMHSDCPDGFMTMIEDAAPGFEDSMHVFQPPYAYVHLFNRQDQPPVYVVVKMSEGDTPPMFFGRVAYVEPTLTPPRALMTPVEPVWSVDRVVHHFANMIKSPKVRDDLFLGMRKVKGNKMGRVALIRYTDGGAPTGHWFGIQFDHSGWFKLLELHSPAFGKLVRKNDYSVSGTIVVALHNHDTFMYSTINKGEGCVPHSIQGFTFHPKTNKRTDVIDELI